MQHDLFELERELVRYVQRFPQAAETADGAHRFWIGSGPPFWSLDEVEQVLRRLTAKGVLEHYVLPGGASLYRARRTSS